MIENVRKCRTFDLSKKGKEKYLLLLTLNIFKIMYSAIEKLKAAKHYLTCQGLPGGYLECNRILNQLGDKIVALAFESGLTLQEQKN